MAPNCSAPCKPDEVCVDCFDLPFFVKDDRSPIPEAFAAQSPARSDSGSTSGASLYSADSEQSLKRRQMRKQKSDATVARFLRELRSYTLPGSSGKEFQVHMLCRFLGITGLVWFRMFAISVCSG
ncbi:unnamed protein product [Symbiodinium necroappetens]|uniref:Uncharacterized protein n=1 Tax=Symbiodinium necroappetens TaxID=1628268 RepID=A0A812P4K8_9DINO|nr:unnamed protein product [Symbiodinium necroappetens]